MKSLFFTLKLLDRLIYLFYFLYKTQKKLTSIPNFLKIIVNASVVRCPPIAFTISEILFPPKNTKNVAADLFTIPLKNLYSLMH